MSLIGQIWLKLFLVLVLAFLGSVAVHTDAMRETLQTQLRLKNSDNATALALVLSQQKGDAALMELAMSAQFDTGFYRRIRFVLANPDAPEFAALQTELSQPGMPKALEGELIDLLNFLEFVSGLTRRGLVAKRDIDWMFANFIDRVVGVDFVRAYVLRSHFDELVVACRRAERAKK